MSKPNILRYHQAIFDFLNIKPTISPSALELIEERETVCGTTFPLSVKEWYSIEGAIELFEEYRSDRVVSLEELGDPEEIFHGYLSVVHENQGVVIYYVHLDGSDDPPVFSTPEWENDLSNVGWYSISDKFSTFIFNMIRYDEFQWLT